MRPSSSVNRVKTFARSKLFGVFLINFLPITKCHFYNEHISHSICIWVCKIMTDCWVTSEVGSSAIKPIISVVSRVKAKLFNALVSIILSSMKQQSSVRMKLGLIIAIRISGFFCFLQFANNPVLDRFECFIPWFILQRLYPNDCYFWSSKNHHILEGLRNFAYQSHINGRTLGRQAFITNRLKYLLFVDSPISLLELFEAIFWDIVLHHFHFFASTKRN